jgi:hypothetical protein
MKKKSISEQLQDDYESTFRGLQACKAVAYEMAELSTKLADLLQKYEDGIRAIRKTDNDESLTTLMNRIEGIRQCRNRAELGCFVLETNKVMEKVYQRIP